MTPLQRKLKNTILLFLFSTLLLSCLRIWLYFTQSDYFSVLDWNELFASFLMGIRVDIIVLSAGLSFIILLLHLPFRFTFSLTYQKVLYFLWFLVVSFIIFIQIADLVYFEYVSRHITNEILVMGDDAHSMLDMALLHYREVLVFAVVVLTLFYVVKKVPHYRERANVSLFKNSMVFFALVLLLLLGIRSNFSSKPLGIPDTFTSSKTQSGNLALNGTFSIVKTLSGDKKQHKFFDTKEALKNTQTLLNTSEFRYVSSEYPLAREVVAKETKPLNVVIILLESWSAKYIDSFAGTKYGVTPNFDALAHEGVMFTNFYANGQRSVEGITALFTGLPQLPGFEYLGHGLELNNLSYIAKMASNNGYDTLAMQSSNRGSFRIDSIAQLAGFKAYYGAEDIPDLGLEEAGIKPEFGTWDNNMLSFYAQKIDTLQEPFLAFTFTSSTHPPFVSPGKKWEKYPHDAKSVYGFFNTLFYADEALGRFMEHAKKQSWYEKTVFVFLADHTLGYGSDSEMSKGLAPQNKERALENMRIPLVIYAPKIFSQHKTISSIGSQADIFPTLASFLGWKGSLSTLGNSLFSDSRKDFALFRNGNILGYVAQQGYIKHTLQQELENTIGKDANKDMLSIYQSINQLLLENKFALEE